MAQTGERGPTLKDLVEVLTRAFTGDSRNRHAKRRGSPNIGPGRARDVAYRIVCGLIGAMEDNLPINYRTIGVKGEVDHQLVKEFFEWMEASRIIEQLLALLGPEQKKNFNALVLTSVVQRVWGPNRPFAVHFHMPSEVRKLAKSHRTPAGLRELIRQANTGAANKPGAAASAIGVLASATGASIVLDEPFALDGWYLPESYGVWRDDPDLEAAIRAAAKLDDSSPLPSSMAAIARMAINSLRRLETHGFDLWLESGRLTHGYDPAPRHAEPAGLLPNHPLPGEQVDFMAADLDALAVALEHERVLLDLPDPFSAPDFDGLELAFEVDGADGEPVRLTAQELRRSVVAADDDPGAPDAPWRKLSRAASAEHTATDPAWPPDVAYLPCTVSSFSTGGAVDVTLILYSSGRDRRTSLFVTAPLPRGATPENSEHLRQAIRQTQRHLDRYGRNQPLDVELRAHAPVEAAPLRGVNARRNMGSLTSVARVVSP
jgi:hypothetical protein